MLIHLALTQHFVGNKVKGGIWKRVFQENKARHIFHKNEQFLPPDTHTHVRVRLRIRG